jgi:hypothetical protein
MPSKHFNEDDWFDYKLEHDERFLARIALARESLRNGYGVRLEEIDDTEVNHDTEGDNRAS